MVKINQGNTCYTFQCKRCVAVFRKQEYLDAHMEIVHKVIIDGNTPKQRIKNNRKASVGYIFIPLIILLILKGLGYI
jgi:uncharacterized C2H2 Zn-finger protein